MLSKAPCVPICLRLRVGAVANMKQTGWFELGSKVAELATGTKRPHNGCRDRILGSILRRFAPSRGPKPFPFGYHSPLRTPDLCNFEAGAWPSRILSLSVLPADVLNVRALLRGSFNARLDCDTKEGTQLYRRALHPAASFGRPADSGTQRQFARMHGHHG
jgi:hypothetical protein